MTLLIPKVSLVANAIARQQTNHIWRLTSESTQENDHLGVLNVQNDSQERHLQNITY